jgi:hypothetical protein
MTTTIETLAALAGFADGQANDMRLDTAVYGQRVVRLAAAEFIASGLAIVESNDAVHLVVRQPRTAATRRIIGSFLDRLIELRLGSPDA